MASPRSGKPSTDIDGGAPKTSNNDEDNAQDRGSLFSIVDPDTENASRGSSDSTIDLSPTAWIRQKSTKQKQSFLKSLNWFRRIPAKKVGVTGVREIQENFKKLNVAEKRRYIRTQCPIISSWEAKRILNNHPPTSPSHSQVEFGKTKCYLLCRYTLESYMESRVVLMKNNFKKKETKATDDGDKTIYRFRTALDTGQTAGLSTSLPIKEKPQEEDECNSSESDSRNSGNQRINFASRTDSQSTTEAAEPSANPTGMLANARKSLMQIFKKKSAPVPQAGNQPSKVVKPGVFFLKSSEDFLKWMEDNPKESIWKIPVKPSRPFKEVRRKLHVPNTSSIMVCSDCEGTGMFRCNVCCQSGNNFCADCAGFGGECRRCVGTGYDPVTTCGKCLGKTHLKCLSCSGLGSYERHLQLVVRRYVLKSSEVIHFSSFNKDFIDSLSGEILEAEESERVTPISEFPNNKINRFAKTRFLEHLKAAANNVLIKQRQRVEVIPLTEVVCHHKEGKYYAYVCGKERKVYMASTSARQSRKRRESASAK